MTADQLFGQNLINSGSEDESQQSAMGFLTTSPKVCHVKDDSKSGTKIKVERRKKKRDSVKLSLWFTWFLFVMGKEAQSVTSLTSTAKTNRIALVHALSVQHVVDMWEDFAVYVHQHKADRTLCSMMHEKYPGTFVVRTSCSSGSCARLYLKVIVSLRFIANMFELQKRGRSF